MKLLCIKKSKSELELIDSSEIELFQLLPNDMELTIEVKVERDLTFHRKFRGFLNTVYDTMPEWLDKKYPTFEVFYKDILLATGNYRFKKSDDVIELEYNSTSFAAMDEIAYRNFVLDTIKLIAKDYFDIGDPKVLLETLTKYKYY